MAVEKERYRWWVLVNSVLVFTFAFGMGWTYIVLVVAEILDDLDLTLTDWGKLWSAISFGTLLFAVVGGALGDRYGVRRIVGIGVVLMGLTLVLRSTSSSFGTMYIWLFLFGSSLALTFANVPKALGMWFPPDEFGLANGATLAGYGAGAGSAGVLTPLALDFLGGWRELSSVLGFITIGLGLLWFFTVRDRVIPGQVTEIPMKMVHAVRHVLKVRDVWLVAGCYLLCLGGYIGVIGYAPTYFVTVQGMTPGEAGLVISLIMWANVAGSLILPALSDKIGLRKVFYFPGLFITGICVFLASSLVGAPLWIAAILWGFTVGVSPIAFVVPLEMEGVGSRLAGSAVGVALTAGYLGGVLTPVIGMWLVTMNPFAGFAFWGGCFALSGLLFLLLKETGPRSQLARISAT